MIKVPFLCSLERQRPKWQFRIVSSRGISSVNLYKFITGKKALALHEQLMNIPEYQQILLAVAKAGVKLRQLEQDKLHKRPQRKNQRKRP